MLFEALCGTFGETVFNFSTEFDADIDATMLFNGDLDLSPLAVCLAPVRPYCLTYVLNESSIILLSELFFVNFNVPSGLNCRDVEVFVCEGGGAISCVCVCVGVCVVCVCVCVGVCAGTLLARESRFSAACCFIFCNSAAGDSE